jgi:hypothetical protein
MFMPGVPGAVSTRRAILADNPKTTAANKEFRKARQAEDGKRAMMDYENAAVAARAFDEGPPSDHSHHVSCGISCLIGC